MRKEKEEFYQQATRRLLQQIDKMKMTDDQRRMARRFTLLFRNSFKSEAVKHATFDDQYGKRTDVFTYPSDGFCKASCFAFMNAMDSSDWKLMYISEIWTYGPHFFLYHIPSKQNFDLTADQYTNIGISVPYELGRPERLEGKETASAQRFAIAVADYVNSIQQGGM